MSPWAVSIRRPVFATVLSIALVLFGWIGYTKLPVRELPDIDFPIVSVATTLPGGDPEVVEKEVTEVLEEEINTIEGNVIAGFEMKSRCSGRAPGIEEDWNVVRGNDCK